ncbi:hypothetical protein G9F72_003765 [Clostridium estertheticum]|uniref:hypothetical protein n=1 Tax=Clostridium estertheticum TaxID=238834 RepID=UPI0013E99D04|nr:hypothetical protein [Clostridium estertheticum]MBZ9685469.1 hypothetical protein [Clostridium estertheticum]
MYIDEDTIRSFYQNYMYELETQDLPLTSPYRQMLPFPFFPQGSQGSQGSQGHQGAPSSGPPNFTPSQSQAQQLSATPLAVDPGAIRPCTFRFVYIWPRRGSGFWAWLTFVGPRSVAGFRWDRNGWRYFGMDLRNISSFQCF